MRGRFDLGFRPRLHTASSCFYLRGKENCPPPSIDHNSGLMPKRSREGDEPIAVEIQNHNGPHALEAGKTALPPQLPVSSKQDFRITVSAKNVTLGLQLTTQFTKVVDFAVKGDPSSSIGAAHGLRRCFAEVTNLQPPECESDLRRRIRPKLVLARATK